MNFGNLEKWVYLWTFENIYNDGSTNHERLGKKRFYHNFSRIFYGIVIETNKNKYSSQCLALKMLQYQKDVDN